MRANFSYISLQSVRATVYMRNKKFARLEGRPAYPVTLLWWQDHPLSRHNFSQYKHFGSPLSRVSSITGEAIRACASTVGSSKDWSTFTSHSKTLVKVDSPGGVTLLPATVYSISKRALKLHLREIAYELKTQQVKFRNNSSEMKQKLNLNCVIFFSGLHTALYK